MVPPPWTRTEDAPGADVVAVATVGEEEVAEDAGEDVAGDAAEEEGEADTTITTTTTSTETMTTANRNHKGQMLVGPVRFFTTRVLTNFIIQSLFSMDEIIYGMNSVVLFQKQMGQARRMLIAFIGFDALRVGNIKWRKQFLHYYYYSLMILSFCCGVG